MELRNQLAFLRSSLPLIIACTLLAAAAALVVSAIMPKTYESKVVLLVGQSLSPGANNLDSVLLSQRLSQTYATLAVTDPVATAVIGELGLPTTSEELLKHVQADAGLDSTLVTITVQSEDPQRAAQIADAFAAHLVDTTSAGSDTYHEMTQFVAQDLVNVRSQIDALQPQIDVLTALRQPTVAQTAQLDALQVQIASLRQTFATLLQLQNASPANQVTVAVPAIPVEEPVSPKILFNTLLGAMLGLVIGIVLAYTRRRLDDTVRTPEQLENVTGQPFLGAIVRMPGDNRRPLYYRLATLLYPRSPAAEGFRHIRTGIEFASTDEPIRTLLVTSAMPGDGKTTFAANLAVVFAQAGRRVCLVDVDLRKPDVHTIFGVPNVAGLSNVLNSEEMTFSSITSPTEVAGLRILTCGPVPSNPAELVSSARMRAVITSLLEDVDLIIMDSPPLQAVTDAAILASIADGTVLVASAGKTRRAALERARDTLVHVGARVLGAGLNSVDERQGDEAAFGYFTYYGASDQPIEGTKPVRATIETGTPSRRSASAPTVQAGAPGRSER